MPTATKTRSKRAAQPPVDLTGLTGIPRLRAEYKEFTIKKELIPDLEREVEAGWLLHYLEPLESMTWGRWNYWAECQYGFGTLPERSIPRIDLDDSPSDRTRKMLENALDSIPRHGSWQSMGGWQYFVYFLDWMLYGFGHPGQPEKPAEPDGCDGAFMRLYQTLDLAPLLLWPSDYLGQMMAENEYGRRQGFFPTPHQVCEFMVQILMLEEDCRAQTVCDPCLGSGRMLLHASNHSLRLYGMDIDQTMCKASLVNGYLYAPWLVKPIQWLDPEMAALSGTLNKGAIRCGNSLLEPHTTRYDVPKECALEFAADQSEKLAATAPPHYLENAEFPDRTLSDTEHDADGQAAVAPIIKRSKKMKQLEDAGQNSLF